MEMGTKQLQRVVRLLVAPKPWRRRFPIPRLEQIRLNSTKFGYKKYIFLKNRPGSALCVQHKITKGTHLSFFHLPLNRADFHFFAAEAQKNEPIFSSESPLGHPDFRRKFRLWSYNRGEISMMIEESPNCRGRNLRYNRRRISNPLNQNSKPRLRNTDKNVFRRLEAAAAAV
jgi:hypothetical protein